MLMYILVYVIINTVIVREDYEKEDFIISDFCYCIISP